MRNGKKTSIASWFFNIILCFYAAFMLFAGFRLIEIERDSLPVPEYLQHVLTYEPVEIYKVSINKALGNELETLPGIGPVMAERIIAFRESNGGFSSLEELMQVQGIGEKRFEDIKRFIVL